MGTTEYFFWLCIFFVAYTYFGYPLLVTLCSSIYSKVNKQTTIEPKVSLIIAAYNEEAVIEKKIKNSLALSYPKEKLQIPHNPSEDPGDRNSLFAPLPLRVAERYLQFYVIVS